MIHPTLGTGKFRFVGLFQCGSCLTVGADDHIGPKPGSTQYSQVARILRRASLAQDDIRRTAGAATIKHRVILSEGEAGVEESVLFRRVQRPVRLRADVVIGPYEKTGRTVATER